MSVPSAASVTVAGSHVTPSVDVHAAARPGKAPSLPTTTKRSAVAVMAWAPGSSVPAHGPSMAAALAGAEAGEASGDASGDGSCASTPDQDSADAVRANTPIAAVRRTRRAMGCSPSIVLQGPAARCPRARRGRNLDPSGPAVSALVGPGDRRPKRVGGGVRVQLVRRDGAERGLREGALSGCPQCLARAVDEDAGHLRLRAREAHRLGMSGISGQPLRATIERGQQLGDAQAGQSGGQPDLGAFGSRWA